MDAISDIRTPLLCEDWWREITTSRYFLHKYGLIKENKGCGGPHGCVCLRPQNTKSAPEQGSKELIVAMQLAGELVNEVLSSFFLRA